MKSQHRVRAVKTWQCSSPTAKTQIARCKISLDLTKLNDDGGYAAGQLTGDARAGAWGGSEKKIIVPISTYMWSGRVSF